MDLRNINELTSSEIINIYDNNNKSFRQSAKRANCSHSTFSKYYKNAMMHLKVPEIDNKPIKSLEDYKTKSTTSSLFLNPTKYNTVFLDIEATSLHGDFGVILCCVMKKTGSDIFKVYNIDLDNKDLLDAEKKMLLEIKRDLDNLDGVVTYFGSRYDIPMIRTRMLFHGISPIKKIKSLDLYFTVKRTMNTTSRRLERVSDLLRIHMDKTMPEKSKLSIDSWINVLHSRNKESLNYIIDHCIADVDILEKTTYTLREFLPERIMRI